MNGLDWFVIIGGLAAIAWVNWYFFLHPAATGKKTQITHMSSPHDTRI